MYVILCHYREDRKGAGKKVTSATAIMNVMVGGREHFILFF